MGLSKHLPLLLMLLAFLAASAGAEEESPETDESTPFYQKALALRSSGSGAPRGTPSGGC